MEHKCDYCGKDVETKWKSWCGIPGHGLWMCKECENITFTCGLCDPDEDMEE